MRYSEKTLAIQIRYKGGLLWDPWLHCAITADGEVRRIIALNVGRGYR